MTAREQLERLAQAMPESEAEAYLALPEILAAQEELLAAAEALLRGISEEGRLQPWLQRLGVAVAKARGEAPPAKET